MSKYLILLLALSFHAYADESEPEPTTCSAEESCLRTVNSLGHQTAFKLIQIEDEAGDIVGSKLSSGSAITDIFYEGVEACYQGKIAEVCSMGELMAGNTNLAYSQGGHAKIENFKCFAFDGVINFEYDVHSDYDENPIFTAVKLQLCQ